MRALLATAGLLALAGAASAGPSRPHTLPPSEGGPIVGLAQDGGTIAWLATGTQQCNVVHVLASTGSEFDVPSGASSMTCHWNLADGRPQLALATRSSAVLWTLHESGSTASDYVMTAQEGGRERALDQFSHASDGTGLWLGGVAGAGTTLAYSDVDVEYVDKLACLQGGSCRRHIANGGIRIVTSGRATPLAGAGPALELAAASGRLAYVQASAVDKDGTPTATATAPIEIVDGASGETVAEAQPQGRPLAIGLSPHVLAVLTRNGRHERLAWYDAGAGTLLGSVAVSRLTAPQLATSDRLIVYRVGRVLRGVALPSARTRTLARAAATPVDLSLQSGRLAWGENLRGGGRIRVLSVS